MKFKLETKIHAIDKKITYQDSLFLMGSCFSDEMATKFSNAGFSNVSNPYGTIFHPLPLAKNVSDIIQLKHDFSILEYEGKLIHLDASNQTSKSDNTNFNTELQTQQKDLHQCLKTTSHLFITLGTAWGYREKNSQVIVANCHKLPASFFTKELSSVEEMEHRWVETLQLLYQFNPTIQVIFTVSPVRHVKDGLIENNRSKARLFELISRLEHQFPIYYFPSYELVNDELRDYRFFKEDLVHPNAQALQFIWSKVKETLLEENCKKVADDVEQLRKLAQHQVLSSDQEEIDHFEQNKSSKIKDFLHKHPEVKW